MLAALTFVFPGTHFVLLDSDCIPVTLFEVADLWKEVSLIRNPCEACPLPVPPATDALADLTESAPKASKVGKKDHQHMQIGQGILLVIEHNAEINAGFIVVFGSQHAPPVGETQWNQLSAGTNTNDQDSLIDTAADRLAQLYWSKVQDFISTRTRVADMSSEECAAWVQSGLALTPFAGCSTHTPFDWTMAWSLIGEWTSREIFLPPVGQWPQWAPTTSSYADVGSCLL